MAEYKEEYIPDFLEYCEIMKLRPTTRDQIIFMAGMTFQSLKQQHLTPASTGQPDKPSAS
jgi:hypothetical protein